MIRGYESAFISFNQRLNLGHKKALEDSNYKVTTVKEVAKSKVVARETVVSTHEVPPESLNKLIIDTNPVRHSLDVQNLALSMQKSPDNVDKAIDLSTKCIDFLKQRLNTSNQDRLSRFRRVHTTEEHNERPFARAFSIDVTPSSPTYSTRAKSRDAAREYNPSYIRLFDHLATVDTNQNVKDLYIQKRRESSLKKSLYSDNYTPQNNSYQNTTLFSAGATATPQTHHKKYFPLRYESSAASANIPSRVSGLIERESGEYNFSQNPNINATNKFQIERTPEKPENPSKTQPLRTNPIHKFQSQKLSPTNPRYLDTMTNSPKRDPAPPAQTEQPWKLKLNQNVFASALDVILSSRRLKTEGSGLSSYKSSEGHYAHPSNLLIQPKSVGLPINDFLGSANIVSKGLGTIPNSTKGEDKGPLQINDLYDSAKKQIVFDTSPEQKRPFRQKHHSMALHTENLTNSIPIYPGQESEKGPVLQRQSFDRSELVRSLLNKWEDPRARVATEGTLGRDLASNLNLRGLSQDNKGGSTLIVNHAANLEISQENKENLNKRLFKMPTFGLDKDLNSSETVTPLGLSQKNVDSQSSYQSKSYASAASQFEIEKILDQKLQSITKKAPPKSYTLLSSTLR